jgi:hypothetical protein
MPVAPYGHGTTIEIKNDDRAFFGKVVTKLDELRSMRLGQQLLNEIQKKIIIVPTAPGGGNKCTAGGATIFYRLRAASRGAGAYSVQTELGHALMGAAGAGWTLERIGYTLAGGLSPVTVRTINNLKQTTIMTEDARRTLGNQIAEMIENVADVRQPSGVLFTAARGTHALGDHLLRFLQPWLRPGTGGGSKINYNPDSLLGCMGDKMRPRPPAIGLVHELCHAWRNAVGRRLFDDALSCGLDDDEVMTTGFPPYQYEPYSENLFRATWTTPLEMRVNYR